MGRFRQFVLINLIVKVRELGTGVTEESLSASVEEVFLFEQQIAQVYHHKGMRIRMDPYSCELLNPDLYTDPEVQKLHFHRF
jgi:hypothetical protein